jgi:dephospho-CoA kinase
MALLVGLTGGIASGKSLACRFFRELGAHIVDADQLSREVVRPFSPAWKEIVDTFGTDILGEDNEIDRTALGEIIFSDEKKRRLLEAIVHPRIADETASRVAELEKRHPDGIIIVDAALMIEVEQHEKFERLIVVFVDEETQARRLMERDLLGKAAAHRRIEAQMPLTQKIEFADYVIDNNGSPEQTKEEVQRVYGELKKLVFPSSREPDPSP